MQKIEFIQNNSGLKEKSIVNTVNLFDDGSTIPFISRYRKEMTGGLDEVKIATIRDLAKKYDDLKARQSNIISTIDEQGKLSPELKSKIESCFHPVQLEDIYLPYKQKRLTRGEKARKLGLEPLAKMIMSQRGGDPEVMAERFLKGELYEIEDAIDGAKDIIAEWMNESTNLRSRLRQLFEKGSVLQSKLVKGKETAAEKYKDYFDFSERLDRCASHRFLALYRADREGLLSIKARPDEEEGI
ncbi:MAG: RNA-binding transcriptional accessory protein, partial [Crocinitomicaceae bacterium]|nr:RNA-binding transcriptional accessory protein [Crocinitomicaceae bacterium]